MRRREGGNRQLSLHDGEKASADTTLAGRPTVQAQSPEPRLPAKGSRHA
jgi:hypothetical protein